MFYEIACDVCSFGLDLAPVVGTVKSGMEFFMGEDLVTGEEISRGMALIGMIPFSKAVTKGGKALSTVNKVCKVATSIFKQSPKICSLPYKSFTKCNFRYNLKVKTGMLPPGNLHAHHVYPKEFTEQFAALGIQVNDPKHGVWWEATAHWEAHGKFEYNKIWSEHLQRQPSTEELYKIGREIMADYGKKVNF